MLVVVRSFCVHGDFALIASPIRLGPDRLLSPPSAALTNTHERCGKTRLIFQSLILVACRVVDSVEDIFIYELCAHPIGIIRKWISQRSKMPPLADAIWADARGHETLVLCEDYSLLCKR